MTESIALPPPQAAESAMRCRIFKQTLTLSERLSQFAQRGREQAQTMKPGKARDDVLQKVRQAEVAVHVDGWLSGSGVLLPG